MTTFVSTSANRTIASGLLGLFLCLPTAIIVANPTDAQQSKQLNEVRRQITRLQSQLDLDRSEKSGLTRQLRDIERQSGKIARRLIDIKSEIKGSEKRLRNLRTERKSLRSNLNIQRDVLGNQIRASYAIGRQEQLKLLLNQEDPASVGRVMVYYDIFNQRRAEQIEKVNVSLERLTAVEANIKTTQLNLDRELQREELEQTTLNGTRETRRKVLNQLNVKMNKRGEKLSQLQADENRLSQLIESLQLARLTENIQQPFAKMRGKLNWPTHGKIAARFGTARKIGDLSWQGVMITAKAGVEVNAISHGRIAFSDWLRGFGLLTIIDHGDGYMSLYGHNETLLKEVGDWVEADEIIATIGDSGGLAKSGLYFEIRLNGKPVNPVRWCRRAKGNVVGMIWENL